MKLSHKSHTQSRHSCTDSFTEVCLNELKNMGLRVTDPRRAVIDCLASATVPMSPKAIHEAVSLLNNVKGSDQVSVYRTLETLRSLGLIHQVFPDGHFVRCHEAPHPKAPHVLMSCEHCGKTFESQINPEGLDLLLAQALKDAAFVADRYILQVTGHCIQCEKQA